MARYYLFSIYWQCVHLLYWSSYQTQALNLLNFQELAAAERIILNTLYRGAKWNSRSKKKWRQFAAYSIFLFLKSIHAQNAHLLWRSCCPRCLQGRWYWFQLQIAFWRAFFSFSVTFVQCALLWHVIVLVVHWTSLEHDLQEPRWVCLSKFSK